MTTERHTNPAEASAPRAARRGRGPLRMIWASTCVFLALLAALAWQMAEGRDPALRARAAATPPPPRRVLVRRIIERRVVVHLPANVPPRASSSSQQMSGGTGGFPTAVTRTS